jgi:sugar O-acyltransferase (sialic acid O-acetyltransferase NeuD family)
MSGGLVFTASGQRPRLVGLLGAGGLANEVYEYCKALDLVVQFVAVEPEHATQHRRLREVPLIGIDSAAGQAGIPVVCAVGAPGAKRRLLEEWALQDFFTICHPRAHVAESAQLCAGVIVAPGAAVSSSAKLGMHVLVNLGATVNHDVTIGSYTSVSPGAHVGGEVTIGSGAFIGIGATIKNGVSIADGVLVGAGSVVLHNITEPNSVVFGVPARRVTVNSDWVFRV